MEQIKFVIQYIAYGQAILWISKNIGVSRKKIRVYLVTPKKRLAIFSHPKVNSLNRPNSGYKKLSLHVSNAKLDKN